MSKFTTWKNKLCLVFPFVSTAGSVALPSKNSSVPSKEPIWAQNIVLFLNNILKKNFEQEQMIVVSLRRLNSSHSLQKNHPNFELSNILKLFGTIQCRQITFSTEQPCSANRSVYFSIASLISLYAKWSDAQRPCSGSNCPGLRCSSRARTSQDATQQWQKRGI